MTELVRNTPALAPRATEAHKGNFGRVLIVGGCREMVGAPSLAAQAALRSGAGLVRVAVPESIQLTVASLVPCATTLCLAETDRGGLSLAAVPELCAAMKECDCLALGPGLGQSSETTQVLAEILRCCAKPIVIDADGLNGLARLRHQALPLPVQTILTPHPGEMARLWRAWLRDPLPAERTAQAERLARLTKAVIVLKGAQTVVADGARLYVNDTGNPGMATGGSGDVLTGVIAGLLGQGLSLFDAAVLAVRAHGRAGDLAAAARTEIGMIASDLIDFLPRAWSEFTRDGSTPS